MARRKNSEDGGMNLDSLLDTMTNVVGILIIVLIVTQLNVAAAVKRIFSEFPPVSEQQLVDLKEQVKKEREELLEMQKTDPAKLKKDKEDLEKQLAEVEKKRKSALEELEGLKKAGEESQVALLKLEAAKKLAAEKKAESDAKEAEVNALLAEADRLKGILDDTPILTAPPPRVVRLPDPRSVPPGARPKTFYCVNNRVIYFPMDEFHAALKEKLEKAVESRLNPENAKMVVSKKEKVVDNRKVTEYVFDANRVLAYLKENPLENATMRATLTVGETSTRGRLTLVPKEGAGDTYEQLSNPLSGFRRGVLSLQTQNIYLWFIVLPDSFGTYLRAREIVDAAKVAAGWEPGWAPAKGKTVQMTATCYTVLFKRRKDPPPPDPNKPPPPPKPKQPGRQLD